MTPPFCSYHFVDVQKDSLHLCRNGNLFWGTQTQHNTPTTASRTAIILSTRDSPILSGVQRSCAQDRVCRPTCHSRGRAPTVVTVLTSHLLQNELLPMWNWHRWTWICIHQYLEPQNHTRTGWQLLRTGDRNCFQFGSSHRNIPRSPRG